MCELWISGTEQFCGFSETQRIEIRKEEILKRAMEPSEWVFEYTARCQVHRRLLWTWEKGLLPDIKVSQAKYREIGMEGGKMDKGQYLSPSLVVQLWISNREYRVTKDEWRSFFRLEKVPHKIHGVKFLYSEFLWLPSNSVHQKNHQLTKFLIRLLHFSGE